MYKSVAVIVVATLGLAAFVAVNPPRIKAPEQSQEVTPAAQAKAPVKDKSLAGNGMASITLTRSADGHFYADAMVNGRPLRFLVDTGATSVALTRADAQSIGLQFNESEFTATGQGAGGEISMKPVTLERLAIGPVEANNVSAMIADPTLRQSLLGQSFLSRVSSVVIQDNAMELR